MLTSCFILQLKSLNIERQASACYLNHLTLNVKRQSTFGDIEHWTSSFFLLLEPLNVSILRQYEQPARARLKTSLGATSLGVRGHAQVQDTRRQVSRPQIWIERLLV